MPIRLAQVTDAHIGLCPETEPQADSKAQFRAVLEHLSKRPLDLVVFSGDLAGHEGEQSSYAWLGEVLADFALPYVLMAGNHDELQTMSQHLHVPREDVQNGELCFVRSLGELHVFCLDSSSYRIPSRQWEWLHQQLLALPDSASALLFVHHPPLLCGCAFMDTQAPLLDSSEAWQRMRTMPRLQDVFCGHYHTERSVMRDGKRVHLSPSTLFQIDPFGPDFRIEHTRPGFRMIEWSPERLITWVEYL